MSKAKDAYLYLKALFVFHTDCSYQDFSDNYRAYKELFKLRLILDLYSPLNETRNLYLSEFETNLCVTVNVYCTPVWIRFLH